MVGAPQDWDRHQAPINPVCRWPGDPRQSRAGPTASGEGSQAGTASQDTTSASLIGSRAPCVEGHKQKISKHDHKT